MLTSRYKLPPFSPVLLLGLLVRINARYVLPVFACPLARLLLLLCREILHGPHTTAASSPSLPPVLDNKTDTARTYLRNCPISSRNRLSRGVINPPRFSINPSLSTFDVPTYGLERLIPYPRSFFHPKIVGKKSFLFYSNDRSIDRSSVL